MRDIHCRYPYGNAAAPTALDEIQVYHDAALTATDLQKIYAAAMPMGAGRKGPSSTGTVHMQAIHQTSTRRSPIRYYPHDLRRKPCRGVR